MDVMRPKLIWIDGAYYRVNHTSVTNGDEDPEDFIRENHDMETEEMISAAPVEEWRGKFRALLDIPNELYGNLIGKRGASLHQVQDHTGCKVTIPRGPRSKAAAVEVVGDQRRAVVRACNMLMMSADRGRQKLRPSHFVAVRLATQHVQNRLETFKVEALEVGSESRGVVPALFQEGPRLHLTFSMLTLLSEAERQAVCRKLAHHAEELRALLPPRGVSLRLRQLDVMNDDESEARVLYVRLHESDDSGAVQRLADRCQQLMVSTGFGRQEHDSVKLHCTLMNVSFLTRQLDESDPQYSKLHSSTFDASAIMKELKHFDFGTVAVDKLEVVQRQAYGEDGFYLSMGCVSLK